MPAPANQLPRRGGAGAGVPAWAAPVRARAAAERLAELVKAALGSDPPVPVQRVCEPTTPVRALLGHGHGASLLVLATSVDLATGRGLGATALACVRHPACPVVVLPERSWER